MIVKYQTITATTAVELDERVNQLLHQGWRLNGYINIIAIKTSVAFFQNMTLHAIPKKYRRDAGDE